jgi:hypothetical protein
MTFNDSGHLVRTVNQFAQGDSKAVANRLASQTSTKQAGNLSPSDGNK